MNWRWKALLQLALSSVPGGEWLNYIFQTYITKSLPESEAGFVAKVGYARQHIDAIQRYHGRSLDDVTFYEFGAGWDMIIPLAFYGFGVERQILIDIRHLSRPKLINDAIEKYTAWAPYEFLRKPDKRLMAPFDFAATLKQYYGIDYRAPCDPRRTGLESGSIDCITSTSTLEHIPLEDIKALLLECHRILRDEGLMSCIIDYLDHYSYFDKKISAYNYLQYSDATWALFNPALHYQNRLRHRDYLDLFYAAGFEIVEEARYGGTERDLEVIGRLSLDQRFRTYSLQDLAVGSALIVARKSHAATHRQQ